MSRTGPAGLVLRAPVPEDWAGLADIRSLPAVVAGTMRLPFEAPETAKRLIETRAEGDLQIVAALEDRIVGHLGLHRQLGRRRHAAILGMMVHDNFQGQGVGRRLLTAALDAADNWLDLRRVELTVYVDNARAIALYESAGFAPEGVLRAYAFKDGAYADALAMARLRG